MEDLKYHMCRESGNDSWVLYDKMGFYLDRVCSACEKAKRSKWRPGIVEDDDSEEYPVEEDIFGEEDGEYYLYSHY